MAAVRSLISVITLASAMVAPVTAQQPATAQSQVRPAVYVAPFTAIRPLDATLLNSFTSDFEAVLITSSCYRVVERRILDQLIAQIRNEHVVETIGDLGKEAQARFKLQKADAVF